MCVCVCVCLCLCTRMHCELFLPELEQAKRMAEQDKKSHDDVVRERDILTKVWMRLYSIYNNLFGETDGQTDRQMDRQMDKQAERTN